MKKFIFSSLFIVITFLLSACHTASITKFTNKTYEPTDTVLVYSDISTIEGKYFEIGYVEAKGGITVSKQALLDDMIEKAKEQGADGLIKIQFSDNTNYSSYLGTTYTKPSAKAIMIKLKKGR